MQESTNQKAGKYKEYHLYLGFSLKSFPMLQWPAWSLHPLQSVLVGYPGVQGEPEDGDPVWFSQLWAGATFKSFFVDITDRKNGTSGSHKENLRATLTFLHPNTGADSWPFQEFPGQDLRWELESPERRVVPGYSYHGQKYQTYKVALKAAGNEEELVIGNQNGVFELSAFLGYTIRRMGAEWQQWFAYDPEMVVGGGG